MVKLSEYILMYSNNIYMITPPGHGPAFKVTHVFIPDYFVYLFLMIFCSFKLSCFDFSNSYIPIDFINIVRHLRASLPERILNKFPICFFALLVKMKERESKRW